MRVEPSWMWLVPWRKDPESSLPLLPCEDTARRWPSRNQPPELWGINSCLCISRQVCGALCYSSLNGLRHHFKMVVRAHERSHYSYKKVYTPTTIKKTIKGQRDFNKCLKAWKWWSADRWGWAEAADGPQASPGGFLPRKEAIDLPSETPERL